MDRPQFLAQFFSLLALLIIDVSLLLNQTMTINYISLYIFLLFLELRPAQFLFALFLYIFNFNETQIFISNKESISVISLPHFDAGDIL